MTGSRTALQKTIAPIESLLQFRFATPKPLKTSPGVGSLRNHSFVQLALVDEGRKSVILDIAGYPPGERVKNQIGAREALPKQYGDAPEYTLVVAGGDTDIKPVPAIELEARIRRAHSLIWAGGRRDIPFPS